MSSRPAELNKQAGAAQHLLPRGSASRLYRDRVKAALTRGLLNVQPQATLDAQGYVVDVTDNLLPGLSARDIEWEFTAGPVASCGAKCAHHGRRRHSP